MMRRLAPAVTSAMFAAFAVLLSVAASGCADARCDPHPVGEPWKKYEAVLPDKAVVCGPNRTSAKKASDIVDAYPPTHVFVFYEETNAAAAFLATLKKLETAGWKTTPDAPIGKGKSALFSGKATKGGVTISIGVNRNDWGTQGSFDLGN